MRSSASGAPPTNRVRRLIGRAAREVRDRHREVSVYFCGDRRMAGLNRRWRRKNRPTDVLAFPAAGGDRGFLGDIVISIPYATRQARRRGETAAKEIDRLLLHGYLHLLGYDHETDEGEMDALEARLRGSLGIAERSVQGSHRAFGEAECDAPSAQRDKPRRRAAAHRRVRPPLTFKVQGKNRSR